MKEEWVRLQGVDDDRDAARIQFALGGQGVPTCVMQ
jgi:hypothetical protein